MIRPRAIVALVAMGLAGLSVVAFPAATATGGETAPSAATIIETSLGPAPADFLASGYRGTWVILTVEAGAPDLEDHEAISVLWEATLSAGAVREQAHEDELPVPEGYGVLLRRSDGTTEPRMAWPFTGATFGQRFEPAGSRTAVERATREALLATGLEPISVEGLAPRDLALAVVAEAGDDTRSRSTRTSAGS